MMTKPSTFLMTTSVIGLGGLLRTLRGAFTEKLTASRFFVWLIYFLLSTFVVAGPYYCFILSASGAIFMTIALVRIRISGCRLKPFLRT